MKVFSSYSDAIIINVVPLLPADELILSQSAN